MIRVITPASNRALTTLDTAKMDLGISGSDQDALLSGLIDRASAIAATYCHRVFARETVEETFDLSRPAESLGLSRWPVITIISATMGGVDVDAYRVGADDGIIERMAGTKPVPWPATQIVIRYIAGMVLPGETEAPPADYYFRLPGDIEAGCLAIVRRLYHGRDRDPALKSVTYGNDAIVYGVNGRLDGETMPGEVVNLLKPHLQRPLG